MNGSSITNQEWSSSHSETSEYESAVTTSLPLHAVNCTDGGVACVFDNGNNEYQVQSPIIDCPTSKILSLPLCVHMRWLYFQSLSLYIIIMLIVLLFPSV